jgi:hypothetical protein
VIGPRGWYTKLRRGTDMPLINVKLIEGFFTASQKR